MWFLAQKKISAKLVKKCPKYSQKFFSWPKMGQKGQKSGFQAQKKFSTKLVKKCPKYGQKFFSRPKIGLKGQKSGFRPRKNFQPNWSKNIRNKAKSCFLGLKWV